MNSLGITCHTHTDYHTSPQVDLSVDLFDIAKETDGFSGSDLREMCRDAALLCVRDFVHNQNDRYATVYLLQVDRMMIKPN